MNSLKRTPLYAWHVAHGARMVDFGGWEMPLQYAGIIEEHRATRERAGLFDVSHMGEIDVHGQGALPFLQYLLTRNIDPLPKGHMKLSLILNESGGIKDDVTVYARGENSYRLVTNAANKEKILAWLLKVRDEKQWGKLDIKDVSEEVGKIDLQGPAARAILGDLGVVGGGEIPYYRFIETKLISVPALISRSGYTGEDGFEIYVSGDDVQSVWEKILEVGKPYGVMPVGLGARDTLRLEAGMMLYGNELEESVNPFEVVYEWVVDMGKEFLGKDALVEIKKQGVSRTLVGFIVDGRGIARHGYAVVKNGIKLGEVTSGTFSPTLGQAIGMAFIPVSMVREGEQIEIDVRGHTVSAHVVRLPFYRRKRG
ncbi:MAG: glycine cleavage system aminomethyltransferase GcvT [Syntrophales bacterium]|nr:glycine cleavage system aminomethyltransferase GcvT [Syntrophales bacterium]